jgi:hypothetical protein
MGQSAWSSTGSGRTTTTPGLGAVTRYSLGAVTAGTRVGRPPPVSWPTGHLGGGGVACRGGARFEVGFRVDCGFDRGRVEWW